MGSAIQAVRHTVSARRIDFNDFFFFLKLGSALFCCIFSVGAMLNIDFAVPSSSG